jgi:hypothetical protein
MPFLCDKHEYQCEVSWNGFNQEKARRAGMFGVGSSFTYKFISSVNIVIIYQDCLSEAQKRTFPMERFFGNLRIP